MKDMDFIKQQILELEDFENISDTLKKAIEENDEYRTLYEECREMSERLRGACPEPEKDGIRLRDAIMSRVADGDTAPRYINTQSFRFPFATVACLAVFAVVVLVSKSGYMQKNFSAESDNNINYSAMDIAYDEDADEVIPEAAAGGAADTKAYNDAEYQREAVMFGAAPKVQTEEAENEAAEEVIPEAENGVVFFEENQSTASDNGAYVQRTETTGYSVFSDELKDVTADYDYKSKVTNDTCDAQAAEEEAVAEENAEELSEKALSYIAEAARLCKKDDIITKEQIILLGEENYIAFFESICENENFAELYTYENFKAFCEE